MPEAEPFTTALLMTTFGVLLAVSVIFSRASARLGVPVALIFLALGMLAGSEGIGGIQFENYGFAFRLGSIALALILFDGGLNTPLSAVRQSLAPAGLLATVGVLGTAALVSVAAHALGFAWPQALLLGAIVSSTDAAAVFSVLRGSGIHLKRRIGTTLELESGINDPVAVILTAALTRNAIAPGSELGWQLPVQLLIEMAVGGAMGAAVGFAGRALLTRIRLPAGGLYPALTLAIAFLAFGSTTLLHGSGFLAVYVCAVILGNGPLPYRAGLLRVHDALAWLCQIAMFLVLGLLVFPSRLLEVAVVGTVLALFLTAVARPLMALLCLAPLRFARREIAYVGWAGLRGAVPIILATFPVLARAPGAERIFDAVFFIVVVNTLLLGTTMPWVARVLRLESREPPPPQAVLEIESMQPLRGTLASYYVDEALVVSGAALSELPFPDGAAVTLIVRGLDIVAPKGSTVLEPGDHVYVFSRFEDTALIRLMFGGPEGGE